MLLKAPGLLTILLSTQAVVGFHTETGALGRHACAVLPRVPSEDPLFGIDNIVESLRLVKEHRRMQAIYHQVQSYDQPFESWPFGRRVITTADPRNIQFVPATEHEKFGVAPIREGAQGPMTGRGIIMSDGEIFDVHVERYMKLLPDDGGMVDLQPLLDRSIEQEILDATQKGVGISVLLGKMSFLVLDHELWESSKLIQEYILVHELVNETGDKDVLCSQLLNVFFAGRDSPAVALTNTFFCLARHPRTQDLTFEKLRCLRYVQHVLNEALHLYPPVMKQSRACTASTLLPLAADTISMDFFTVHRNPGIYSPDPETFRPERATMSTVLVAYTLVRIALRYSEAENRDLVVGLVENMKLNMESLNGTKVGLIAA
ncbi:cytochrome P450 [Zopfia rhizophila CBS 207.26]|uniref:Cytochrome P450 n=1 Tax=Zopfia rhizophila CBS 207.26 TaxID=1314779 RepID=A0A6A6EF54_9PEZI|nr:cytochrome P450 [Zopfia rhizophila CBS 207.26]